jgi:hypothetical protein
VPDQSGADDPLTHIKIRAANGPTLVQFEPLGDTVDLEQDDWITVRTDPATPFTVEIVVSPTGLSVWLPYPGQGYVVSDSKGEELLVW